MTPKAPVKRWVEIFKEGDEGEIAGSYHWDAINHEVANKTVNGKEVIRKMFAEEFDAADMTCIVENIFEDGEWAILEWKDQLGLRRCGFFQVAAGRIKFHRGYWNKLSFLKLHNLPIPKD